MKDSSEVIRVEAGDIKALVRVACAVEQARTGTPVDPHDTAVQVRVADMILGGLGEHLRLIHGEETGVPAGAA